MGGLDLKIFRSLIPALSVGLILSFDGFIVGIAYSLKRFDINYDHYWKIGICSGTMIGTSMISGKFFASVISHKTGVYLGASILIALGIWQIIQQYQKVATRFFHQTDHTNCSVVERSGVIYPQHKIKNSLMQNVAEILNEPLKADRDLSGSIDAGEAWLLSVALGLDAFAAGFGASMVGISLHIIPIAAFASPFFVFLGTILGKRFAVAHNIQYNQVLSGFVLIIIGVLKLLGLF